MSNIEKLAKLVGIQAVIPHVTAGNNPFQMAPEYPAHECWEERRR